MDCLFCRIAAGDVPADVVAQTADALFFRDINPRAPVHVLGIPRRHIPNAAHVRESDGEVLAGIFAAFNAWAAAEGIGSWRVVANVGPDAGQSVDHLHFHFLAGRRLGWPPG